MGFVGEGILGIFSLDLPWAAVLRCWPSAKPRTRELLQTRKADENTTVASNPGPGAPSACLTGLP